MSYRSRIPGIIRDLARRTELTADDAAVRIVTRAKDRVPRRTGALAGAIHKEQTDDGFLVIAGDTDVFYGHIVEHGGAHTGARPFLIPALEETRAEVEGMGRRRLRGL